MEFVKSYTGEVGFIILIGSISGIGGIGFLIFIIKKNFNWIKILTVVTMLIIGLILCWQIKIPQERIHILEYAVLGWLLVKDLNRKNRRIKAFFTACIYCIIVGILDELLQAILPYRVFDWRDIIFNGLGGGWGIILYLLS
jgi:VanZ family protein